MVKNRRPGGCVRVASSSPSSQGPQGHGGCASLCQLRCGKRYAGNCPPTTHVCHHHCAFLLHLHATVSKPATCRQEGTHVWLTFCRGQRRRCMSWAQRWDSTTTAAKEWTGCLWITHHTPGRAAFMQMHTACTATIRWGFMPNFFWVHQQSPYLRKIVPVLGMHPCNPAKGTEA